jgi:hypothetical protein
MSEQVERQIAEAWLDGGCVWDSLADEQVAIAKGYLAQAEELERLRGIVNELQSELDPEDDSTARWVLEVLAAAPREKT